MSPAETRKGPPTFVRLDSEKADPSPAPEMPVTEPEDPMIDDEADTDDDFEECVSSNDSGTSTVRLTDPSHRDYLQNHLGQRC